jgi:hypothetical protein
LHQTGHFPTRSAFAALSRQSHQPLRFFHLAAVVASWRENGATDEPARAIPVRFESSPREMPGKKAIKAEQCLVGL